MRKSNILVINSIINLLGVAQISRDSFNKRSIISIIVGLIIKSRNSHENTQFKQFKSITDDGVSHIRVLTFEHFYFVYKLYNPFSKLRRI